MLNENMSFDDIPVFRFVCHQINRGITCRWYDDNQGEFGFCARAAYALGMDKPRYPMPAIPIDVFIYDWAIYVANTYTYHGGKQRLLPVD